jgi:hypothetical protein
MDLLFWNVGLHVVFEVCLDLPKGSLDVSPKLVDGALPVGSISARAVTTRRFWWLALGDPGLAATANSYFLFPL